MLPVFARSFDVTNLMVGMVVSSFALMRLATSPVCAPLIRRLGERTVLGTGMFIVAASSAAAGQGECGDCHDAQCFGSARKTHSASYELWEITRGNLVLPRRRDAALNCDATYIYV